MKGDNGLVIKDIFTKNGIVYASLYKFDEWKISATLDYILAALHDEDRSALFDFIPVSQKIEIV